MKFSVQNAMKSQKEYRGIAPDGHCHALAASPPGRAPLPIYRRMGGPGGGGGDVDKC